MIIEKIKSPEMYRVNLFSNETLYPKGESEYKHILNLKNLESIFESNGTSATFKSSKDNDYCVYLESSYRLDRVFDSIPVVVEDDVNNIPKTTNKSLKYYSNVPGRAKLIFQPHLGKLFIAYRNYKNQINSQYLMYISDTMADQFIRECKSIPGTKRYTLNYSNENCRDLIKYYSELMYNTAKRNHDESIS